MCRPDGLRRSTCMACRKGCGPEVRQARHRASALRSWHSRKGATKVILRRIVLGPVPCQGCREAVTWNGYAWENADGDRHFCDNTGVGSSDESNTIADGTRIPATTRDAGVIAFRGSSS